MSRVRLTFDSELPGQAHWSPDAPLVILGALAARDVQATFFVQGRWAQTEPDLVRRMRDEGHLIGMHSYFHAPYDTMTLEGLREDTDRAYEALTNFDVVPAYARAPNGRMSQDAALALSRYDLRHHGWTDDTGDWVPTCTVEHIQRVCTEASEGAVVLLHTWPATTAAALPLILDQIECVRLDA